MPADSVSVAAIAGLEMADTPDLAEAAPAEDPSPAAPSLGDLLRMLPLDVVADSIWHRLHCNSCRGHLRQSCRQLRDLSYHIVTLVVQDLRRPTKRVATAVDSVATAPDSAATAVGSVATAVDSAATAADSVATAAGSVAAAVDSAGTAAISADAVIADSASPDSVAVAPAGIAKPDPWQRRIDRQLVFLSRLPRLQQLRLQRWANEDDLTATLRSYDPAVGARVRSLTLFGWPMFEAALQAVGVAFGGLEHLLLCRGNNDPPAALHDAALLPLQPLPLLSLDLHCCPISWDAVHSLVGLSRLQRLALELPAKEAEEDEVELSDQLQPLTALTTLQFLHLLLRQPRELFTLLDVAPLMQLTQLTVLRLPEVNAPDASWDDSADAWALLGGLIHLRYLQLSRGCKVGDAEFAALRQLTHLTTLALHSIHLTRPTPGHLPQLQSLLLWDELKPSQMLGTLLPLLPLPALTDMGGFRRYSQLRLCVSTHADTAEQGGAVADADADMWADMVSTVYAGVWPDGKADSDCDTSSLHNMDGGAESGDDEEWVTKRAVESGMGGGGGAPDGVDAVGRDAEQQAAALRQVALHLAAAPHLHLCTAALVGRRPHSEGTPAGRPLSVRQVVPSLAPLAEQLNRLVLNGWGLETADWAVLGAGLPGLLTLTLERCDFAADALATAVGQLPALERLRLHRCVGVTAEGVQQLVAACPRPVKLHVFPALAEQAGVAAAPGL